MESQQTTKEQSMTKSHDFAERIIILSTIRLIMLKIDVSYNAPYCCSSPPFELKSGFPTKFTRLSFLVHFHFLF